MASFLTAKFTGTTPAAPGSAILGLISPDPANAGGNAVYGSLSRYESMSIECQRVGATGGTLDIYIQVSLDEGTTWTDIGHYTQIAAGGGAVHDIINLARFQTNATPAAPVATGDAVLAANTFINGEYTNRIRFKAVAGASTSAGAAYTIKVFLNSTSA